MALKAGYKGIKKFGPGLKYDNVNGILNLEGESDLSLDNLKDVNITTPADGDYLTYDSSNDEWYNDQPDSTPTEDSSNLITSGGVYSAIEDVTDLIPEDASASNQLATASDVNDIWSANAVLGVHNIAKSYKAETFTEQYYRALNIDMNLQPNTTYKFILEAPNNGNEYYFNDSLFASGDTVTTDGTKKIAIATTKSTLDNSQYNAGNGGWYILKNYTAQSSAPSFTSVTVCLGEDTSDDVTDYAMTNGELTIKVQGIIDAANNAADFAAFKTAIGNL